MARRTDRMPVTARGWVRRERLLDATAQLVAEHGFHAVGISEIGAAAGVTGSAIYRHFGTKTELLVALLERVVDGLLRGADEIVARGDEPHVALEALVRAHVAFALRDRAVLRVYAREAHLLPEGDRRRIRRTQHHYVDRWTATLLAARRDLDPAAARLRVQATFGLLNATADLPAGTDDAATASELTRLALAALHAR